MIKKYAKTTLLLISLVMLISLSIISDNDGVSFDQALSSGSASIIDASSLVALGNTSRKDVHASALKVSPKLRRAAQRKAKDMLKKQYFSHVSPAQKTPWDFMREVGYDYIAAGENLAINFHAAEDVEQGWLRSQSHRDNLLNFDYTETGIGIAKGLFQGQETTVVVQMFGMPFPSGPSLVNRNLPISMKNFVSGSLLDLFSERTKNDVVLKITFVTALMSLLGLLYQRHSLRPRKRARRN